MSVALKKCRRCHREAKTVNDLKMFALREGQDFGRDSLCKKCAADLLKERRKDYVGPKTPDDLQLEQEAMLTGKSFEFKRKRGSFVNSQEIGRRLAYFAGVPVSYGPRLLNAFTMMTTDSLQHRENLYIEGLFRLEVQTKKSVVSNVSLGTASIKIEPYFIKQPQRIKITPAQKLEKNIQVSEEALTPFRKLTKQYHDDGVTYKELAIKIRDIFNAYLYRH